MRLSSTEERQEGRVGGGGGGGISHVNEIDKY